MPGHSDVESNKNADKLVNEGSSQHYNGPEPPCELQTNHIKKLIKIWEESTMALQYTGKNLYKGNAYEH